MLKGLLGEKIIVGYDLANSCCQISYCYVKENSEIETIASVAGEENYDIPTVLCKRQGVNQWLYGKEAQRYMQEYPEEGILVDGLLDMALCGEEVLIDGQSYNPVALLSLFVKRSLGMLAGVAVGRKIAALMITCQKLDGKMVQVLNQVISSLALKNTEVCFQNYTESFYNYMIYQPEELWAYQTLLLDYRGTGLCYYKMECNKRTTPIVAYIHEEACEFDGEDESLLEIVRGLCQNTVISSVYLIGEKFSGDWMSESLKYLCRGRRVFQGNNLYSKGAVFSLLERIHGSENGKNYVYLGNDKLKANIGMKVHNHDSETYYALLDAGSNWYETGYSLEFYLKKENNIELIVTHLTNEESKVIRMKLDELSMEKNDVTKVYMKLYMIAENTLCVEVRDLGFGEIRKSLDKSWREEFILY